MIKTVCTDKRMFPAGVSREIDDICNQSDVTRVINVNIVMDEEHRYIGFVTYESDDVSEQT